MKPPRHYLLMLGSATALLLGSSLLGQTANRVPDAPTVPPAPLVEKPLAPAGGDTVGDQPSTQHQWVPGHWRWQEGAYVWEAGRWDLPPGAGLFWHQPRWEKQPNGYALREGYWDSTPPVAVTPAPAPVPSAPTEIVVTAPPPPLQREVVYERPSPNHVWISGYWGWHLGKHVWVSGRWSTRPRANVVWVSPRWELRGNRYVLIDGYWQDAAPTTVVVTESGPQEVVVTAAPPPPRTEVIYAAPGPDYIWIGGYWGWRGGRHVWVAGHYERPPRGRHHWVAPRWERRGGTHIFIEGRWK